MQAYNLRGSRPENKTSKPPVSRWWLPHFSDAVLFCLATSRPIQQLFNAPSVVSQPAGHRWRLALQRFVLAAEVVERNEDGLHGDMVL